MLVAEGLLDVMTTTEAQPSLLLRFLSGKHKTSDTHTHPQIQYIHRHTHTHTHIHTYIHIYTHTYIHTETQTHTQTQRYQSSPISFTNHPNHFEYKHTYSHTLINTCSFIHPSTHTLVHIYTHDRLALPLSLWECERGSQAGWRWRQWRRCRPTSPIVWGAGYT